MNTSLKQRLAQGGRQLGCILVLPSPDVAEIVGHAGVDVAMIDHEHGIGGLDDFVAIDRATAITAMQTMVRVPHGDFTYARRLLDAGAQALVFPGVDTAAEAAAVVRACRYPPRGERGAGAGIRRSKYGRDMSCFTPAGEDKTLIVVQIESVLAVANVEAICAVEGVDMLLIGPRDLSASLGTLGHLDNPELWDLVRRSAQAIRAAGKYLASTLHPGRTVDQMFAEGYDLVLAGKDVDLIMNGASSMTGKS